MQRHRWVGALFIAFCSLADGNAQGGDEEEEDADRELPAQQKKPKVVLEKDTKGRPILPDPDGLMSRLVMEQIIRSFLTTHYRPSSCSWYLFHL
jgi:hypothetical protein